MKWQILDADNQPIGEHFDDGLAGSPGVEGFATDAVEAEVISRGATSFNYMGESDKEIEA